MFNLYIEGGGSMRVTQIRDGVSIIQETNNPAQVIPDGSVRTNALEATLKAEHNRAKNRYTFVVGSPSDVLAGTANFSDLTAAIAAAPTDSVINLLPGNYNIAVFTFSKRLMIEGYGYGTQITGTFTVSASKITIKSLILNGNVTISGGTTGVFISECWQPLASTFTDLGSGNYVVLLDS